MNLLKLFAQKIELLRPHSVQQFSSLCCAASRISLAKILVTSNSQQKISSPICDNKMSKLSLQSPASSTLVQQTRTYKTKTRLRKRCKSCYFVWRNGRLYVECEENPRHKQHHIKSILKGFESIAHGYDVKAERAQKEAQAALKAALL